MGFLLGSSGRRHPNRGESQEKATGPLRSRVFCVRHVLRRPARIALQGGTVLHYGIHRIDSSPTRPCEQGKKRNHRLPRLCCVRGRGSCQGSAKAGVPAAPCHCPARSDPRGRGDNARKTFYGCHLPSGVQHGDCRGHAQGTRGRLRPRPEGGQEQTQVLSAAACSGMTIGALRCDGALPRYRLAGTRREVHGHEAWLHVG